MVTIYLLVGFDKRNIVSTKLTYKSMEYLKLFVETIRALYVYRAFYRNVKITSVLQINIVFCYPLGLSTYNQKSEKV